MRTRLIKSNNERRARPMFKRVIFFPSSNNGVSFAAREFNHMANNHVLPYPNDLLT